MNAMPQRLGYPRRLKKSHLAKGDRPIVPFVIRGVTLIHHYIEEGLSKTAIARKPGITTTHVVESNRQPSHTRLL